MPVAVLAITLPDNLSIKLEARHDKHYPSQLFIQSVFFGLPRTEAC